mmetsp:Transcript_21629/g.40418  ORF Transcript_21629/g.40418 Transcript_21629/m.40418 type:complete len:381 (-) Transcript_21629:644-1786(-)
MAAPSSAYRRLQVEWPKMHASTARVSTECDGSCRTDSSAEPGGPGLERAEEAWPSLEVEALGTGSASKSSATQGGTPQGRHRRGSSMNSIEVSAQETLYRRVVRPIGEEPNRATSRADLSYELCECGKSVFQSLHNKPLQRRRAYSHSATPSSPPTGRSRRKSVASLQPLTDDRDDVDIEDVVQEPSEDLEAILMTSPVLTVRPREQVSSALVENSEPATPASGSDRASIIHTTLSYDENNSDQVYTMNDVKVCDRCHCEDCVAVKPTVGLYSMSQIRKHNTPEDCWIVAHGVVYDVTRYLRKHPGGARSILTRAGGVDASADYDFHTKLSKKRLWAKYKIGRVAQCTNPVPRTHKGGRHSSSSRRGKHSPQRDDACCIM